MFLIENYEFYLDLFRLRNEKAYGTILEGPTYKEWSTLTFHHPIVVDGSVPLTVHFRET